MLRTLGFLLIVSLVLASCQPDNTIVQGNPEGSSSTLRPVVSPISVTVGSRAAVLDDLCTDHSEHPIEQAGGRFRTSS